MFLYMSTVTKGVEINWEKPAYLLYLLNLYYYKFMLFIFFCRLTTIYVFIYPLISEVISIIRTSDTNSTL